MVQLTVTVPLHAVGEGPEEGIGVGVMFAWNRIQSATHPVIPTAKKRNELLFTYQTLAHSRISWSPRCSPIPILRRIAQTLANGHRSTESEGEHAI